MSNILEWYEKQSDRLRLIFVIISGVALATSLTFSWTGNADKIASSNIAVFDKTGTLTKGKPAVVKVQSLPAMLQLKSVLMILRQAVPRKIK